MGSKDSEEIHIRDKTTWLCLPQHASQLLFTTCFIPVRSSKVVFFVLPASNSTGTPIRYAVQVLRENHFSDGLKIKLVTMTFKCWRESVCVCKGRWGWWCSQLRKILWFECVCACLHVSQWAGQWVQVQLLVHTHANTYMHTFFWVHLTICMLPIWFLLIRVPVIPLLLPLVLSVSLCALMVKEWWNAGG